MVIQVTAEDSFVLRFNRDAYNAKVEEGPEITEGVEEAFEVVDHFYLLTTKPTLEPSVKTVKNKRLLHLHYLQPATSLVLVLIHHLRLVSLPL